MKKKKTVKLLKRLGAVLLSGVLVFTSAIAPSVTVKALEGAKLVDLRVNDLIAPVGIDTPNPVFSWKMDSDVIGAAQTAYHIVVTEEDGSVTWDSGWVNSGESVAIKYDGATLKDQTKYSVSVSIRDQNGDTVEAATTTFVTAFFSQSAFDDTKWISYQDSNTITSLTKYTIDFDFNITNAANGFCFGMNDERNTFVLWQVNAESGYGGSDIILRPHISYNGSWKATPGSVSTTTSVSGAASVKLTPAIGYNDSEIIGKTVHERIEVDGLTVKTYFGTDADNLTLAATNTFGSDYADILKLNKIGFRHNLNGPVEICKYDNIVVKDGNGNVVYSEDFEGEIPVFTGNIEITAQDGMLVVGAQNTDAEGRSVLSGFGSNGNADSLPAFRKDIAVKSGLKSAMLYSSGLGVYEQFINGVRVGNIASDGTVTYDELKPGYTEGVKRRMYNTYDVTTMLTEGAENALSAISSPSWWNANDGYLKQGDVSAYFAKLVLTYNDGTTEVINTDTSWKTAKEAPVLMGTTIYQGEKYNANYDTSWMLPDYNDAAWSTPVLNTEFQGVLTSQVGTTVAVREDLTITPVGYSVYEGIMSGSNTSGFYGKVRTIATYDGSGDITLLPGQTMIVDFGQNFAGWEEFSITTEKGTVVTIDHAEMLNDSNGDQSRGNDGPEGSIYDSSYRNAAAITSYTAAGKENETYHPMFTYYGFRYAEVTVSAKTVIHSIKGKVVTSVHEDTASMTTSNEDVNQLISNVIWSMYSNYLGVPTDCPQRSERFGWAGDTQIFAQTGLFLGNNKNFLYKYTLDLQDGQMTDQSHKDYGAYPAITPGAYHLNCYGDFGWADAGVIVPYYVYVMSGDTTVIENNWDAMCLYMDAFLGDKTYGGNGTYGDWLSYEGDSAMSKNIIATAYHAIDALMMVEMAKAIGNTEAATRYNQRYLDKKEVFQKNFVNKDGTLKESTQAACLYALYADLVDDPDPIVNQLVDNIERNGCKLQTGFLGTAILMPTLTKVGRTDVAYRLLLQHDNPSWLYSVDQGATTIWERWNSYTIADGFGDADMNSFNHYAYGAVLGWMYSDMAGIDYDTENAGFKHFTLTPAPNALIPTVNASYDSPYGTIVSNMSYNYNGNEWNYEAQVPANTTATINVPVEDMNKLTVNGKSATELTSADGIEFVAYENKVATFNAVAGTFNFSTYVEPQTEVNIVAGNLPENMPSGIDADVKVNGVTVARAIPAKVLALDGDVITVTANSINNVDFAVKNWTVDGDVISSTKDLTYTVNGNAEIAVNFKDITMKSIAEDKPVTAREVNSDWAASNLTDGINSYLGGTNGWSNPGTGALSGFTEVTAVIDLEEKMTFDRIHIYPRNDVIPGEVMNCPTAYTIYVSDDNANWTPIYSTKNGEVTNGFKPIVIEFPEQASGRYVKLGVTALNRGDQYGTPYVQLSELGIYCVNHTYENDVCTNCGAEKPAEGNGRISATYDVKDAYDGDTTPFDFVVAPWSGDTVDMNTVAVGTSDGDGKGYTVTKHHSTSFDNSYVSLITNSSDGKTGQLLWSANATSDTQIIFTAPTVGEYTVDFATHRMFNLNKNNADLTGCRFYVKYGDTVLEKTVEQSADLAEFAFTASLKQGETIIFGLDPVKNESGKWGNHAADTSYITKLTVSIDEECPHTDAYTEKTNDDTTHSTYCHRCNTTILKEAHIYGDDTECDVCGYICTHPNNSSVDTVVYSATDGFGTDSYENWSFSLVPWDSSSPIIRNTEYVEGTDAASQGHKTINYINGVNDVKFSMITEEKNGYKAGTLMWNAIKNYDSCITFTAPEAGKYTLDTNLIRVYTASHATLELTGSRIYVMVGNEILEQGTISEKGEAIDFNIEVELDKGETLVLAMDPIKNSVNDWATAGADECYITKLTMTYEKIHEVPKGELDWTITDTTHSAKYICCGTVAVPEAEHTFVDGKCVCGKVDGIIGDANRDEVINLKDLVSLAQLVAGWDTVEENKAIMDLNKDGEIDLQDVNYLARHLAGWDDCPL